METPTLGEARFASDRSHTVSDDLRISEPIEVGAEPGFEFELAGPRAKLFFDAKQTRAGIVTCGGFGLTTPEVKELRARGYQPRDYYYSRNEMLRTVIDYIGNGELGEAELFRPIVEKLLNDDPFLLLADYQAYVDTQERVSSLWRNQKRGRLFSTLPAWENSPPTARSVIIANACGISNPQQNKNHTMLLTRAEKTMS
jgi:hypothetical protein